MSTGNVNRFIWSQISYNALIVRAERIASDIYEIYNVSTFIDEDKFRNSWEKYWDFFIKWLDHVNFESVKSSATIDITFNTLCAHIVRSKSVELDRFYPHAINDNQDYHNANFDIMYYLHLDYPNEIFALRMWSGIFSDTISIATGNIIVNSFVIEKRCDEVEKMCVSLKKNPLYMHSMSKIPDYLEAIMRLQLR